MREKSFERFYLEKVAVGEGCGCAEQAIGMRDMDARAQKAKVRDGSLSRSVRRWGWLRDIIRRKTLQWQGRGG